MTKRDAQAKDYRRESISVPEVMEILAEGDRRLREFADKAWGRVQARAFAQIDEMFAAFAEIASKVEQETEEPMDANKLIASFEQWGIDRRIVLCSSAKSQFMKTVEEVGELASALAKNDKPAMIDAIGDIVVTLTLVASCAGVPLTECMRAAWEQIKDRKGTLTPEGVFVKEP